MKGSDSEWEDEERNPQISWKYTYFLSSPLYQGPHGNHESRKMFYFLAFLRSFPINNNWVRLFWFENHKVKLRWLFDKNPLCCFTTNYQPRPALEMSISKGLMGFSESGSASSGSIFHTYPFVILNEFDPFKCKQISLYTLSSEP